MNKFEKLIELVVEGEDAKAEELFHEIVVEKSRDIYESLMDSEDELGGDAADRLMSDIAADEEGMHEDDEELEMEPEMGAGEDDMDMDDMGMGGEEGEEDLEDRVVDLEDQLDALMAEFDAIMSDHEGGDEMGDMGDMGDEMPMGDEEEEMPMGESEEIEEDEDADALEEGVELKKVSKGIANSTEEGSVNKKSVNNDNSGKKGAVAKPHQEVGEENGRTAPTAKDEGYTTEPNEQRVKEPKKTGEDAGVNKKSISGS